MNNSDKFLVFLGIFYSQLKACVATFFIDIYLTFKGELITAFMRFFFILKLILHSNCCVFKRDTSYNPIIPQAFLFSCYSCGFFYNSSNLNWQWVATCWRPTNLLRHNRDQFPILPFYYHTNSTGVLVRRTHLPGTNL